MVDVTTIKTQLAGLPQRAAHASKVEAWATNSGIGIPEDIIPRVPAGARAALERLAGMCESIGPRIVQTRAFGTIGGVNWGGDDTALDGALRDLDLEGLAEELLTQGMVTGIIAGITRRDKASGELVIEPLVGYVEPVTDPSSRQSIVALLHAWVESSGAQETWSVRLYDLGERTMLEWRGLRTPSDAVKREPQITGPSPEYPAGAPMPRYALLGTYPKSKRPYGEMDRLLPLIQSDWSSQLRGDRAEENTAFPQLKLIGETADGTEERSTAHIIRVTEGGDAAFIVPGDLSQLHTHHDRKLERLREDANMPGGFLGAQTPSGEALREANQKFISACQRYARRLSRVMTALAADFAAALGIVETVEVTVLINREFTKASEIETVVLLYDKGLMDFSAAVRAVSVYVPTWSDAEVEAFIEAEVARLRPPQFVPGAIEDDDGQGG